MSTIHSNRAPAVFSRRWENASQSPVQAGGVYLLHGIGEHCGRYERLANWFANHGYQVASHDHPAHGQSAGIRGTQIPSGTLATQAAIQIQKFAADIGEPPIVFGHSLGGVLALELVLQHELPVKALILSAPAISMKLSKLQLIQLHLFHRLAPDFCVTRPTRPTLLSHDPEIAEMYDADPLNHQLASAGLVMWLYQSGKRSRSQVPLLDVPTLMQIAGADAIADPKALMSFAASAPGEHLTSYTYPDSYHEIYNETDERRDIALTHLANFLQSIS